MINERRWAHPFRATIGPLMDEAPGCMPWHKRVAHVLLEILLLLPVSLACLLQAPLALNGGLGWAIVLRWAKCTNFILDGT